MKQVNKLKTVTIAVLLILILFITSNVSADELSTEQIFEKVSQSVVVIKTYDAKGLPLSLGSGFLLNTKSDSTVLLVTNQHVISGSDDVMFKYADKWIEAAQLYRVDLWKDIAIYEINKPLSGIGLSKTLAKVGQSIVVLGSPEGYENTVSDIIALIKNQNINPVNTTNDKSYTSGAFSLIWYYICTDRYIEAKQLLEEYIGSSSDAPDAWYLLGYVERKLGDTKKEIDYYKRALSIDNNLYYIWNDLGGAYVKQGFYEDGIAAFRQAIKINPDYANAWNNLAVAYWVMGDLSAIKECLIILERLDPVQAQKINELMAK